MYRSLYGVIHGRHCLGSLDDEEVFQRVLAQTQSDHISRSCSRFEGSLQVPG